MRVASAVMVTALGLNCAVMSGPLAAGQAAARPVGQLVSATTTDLLMLLELRRKEVEQLLEDGNLSVAYLPAFIAKDIALILEDRRSEVGARRIAVTHAAQKVVLGAWRIDRDADLGNQEKVMLSYREFAAAVSELTTVFGSQSSR